MGELRRVRTVATVRTAYTITGYTLLAVCLAACWALGSPPAVVAVGLLAVALTCLLTAPFASMLFAGPGVRIEAAREATRELEETVEKVAQTTAPPEIPEGKTEPAFDVAKFLEGVRARGAEQELARRELIEKLMTDAARWGYEMAGLGFRTPPRPVIQWSDDGKPTILYGEGERLNAIERALYDSTYGPIGRLFRSPPTRSGSPSD